MRASAVIEYDLKDCPWCGQQISNYNRNGHPIAWVNYKKKKTCGSSNCVGDSLRETKTGGIVKKQGKFYQEPDLVEKFYLGIRRDINRV